MVASVSIKSNTIQISKEIQNIQKQFPAKIKQILANVSASQLRRIRLRTEKGKSVSGSPFTPYSTKPFFFNTNPEGQPRYKFFEGGYREFRGSKGRSTKPDLNFRGNMLSAMTTKVSSDKASLFFRRQEENKKAFFHDIKGAGKGRVVRPFFSINNKEEDLILKEFAIKIEKILKWVKEKLLQVMLSQS